MEVCQEYYGLPPPPGAFGPFLRLNPGDIVELTKAEAEHNWWEVQAGAVGVMEKDLCGIMSVGDPRSGVTWVLAREGWSGGGTWGRWCRQTFVGLPWLF